MAATRPGHETSRLETKARAQRWESSSPARAAKNFLAKLYYHYVIVEATKCTMDDRTLECTKDDEDNEEKTGPKHIIFIFSNAEIFKLISKQKWLEMKEKSIERKGKQPVFR